MASAKEQFRPGVVLARQSSSMLGRAAIYVSEHLGLRAPARLPPPYLRSTEHSSSVAATYSTDRQFDQAVVDFVKSAAAFMSLSARDAAKNPPSAPAHNSQPAISSGFLRDAAKILPSAPAHYSLPAISSGFLSLLNHIDSDLLKRLIPYLSVAMREVKTDISSVASPRAISALIHRAKINMVSHGGLNLPGGSLKADIFQRTACLRGPRNLICSFSARLAHQYISRRSIASGGGGGGGKSANQLAAWENDLRAWEKRLQKQSEKNKHHTARNNAEKTLLDVACLSLSESWSNIGKVQGRAPPPGPFGALKSLVLDKVLGLVVHAAAISLAYMVLGLVLLQSLQNGELETIHKVVFEAGIKQFRGVANRVRAAVGLPPLDDTKPLPAPRPSTSVPSSVVVVMDGRNPLYTGRISELPSPVSSPKVD